MDLQPSFFFSAAVLSIVPISLVEFVVDSFHFAGFLELLLLVDRVALVEAGELIGLHFRIWVDDLGFDLRF